MRVSEVMTPGVRLVSPEQPISEAARLMAEIDAGALPVSEGDRLTRVFFQRGHLWWKREVAVPAESIAKFESDTVTLGLKKDELGSAQKEPVSGP